MATITRDGKSITLGKNGNPMGRKPLPDEVRKEKPLRIRMAEPDRQFIDEAAELAGYTSSSQWARGLLMKAAKRVHSQNRRDAN